MLTTDQGYAVAHSIDKIFNKTLEKHPISSSENHGGYAVLIRTIQTTLNIAEKENNAHLRCPTCGALK